MVNLSKMKKSELIDYCKELKKENEEIKIDTMKCCAYYEKEKEKLEFQNEEIQKLLKHDIIRDNKLLQEENELLKKDNKLLEEQVDRGDKAYEDLEKQYEEGTQEHSNYWSKSIELERYNKLKEENEKLNKELEYYKNFKSQFNDFVKGHEISSSWGKQYTP
jgi:hypothetical protein